jgi:hypothetical protein
MSGVTEVIGDDNRVTETTTPMEPRPAQTEPPPTQESGNHATDAKAQADLEERDRKLQLREAAIKAQEQTIKEFNQLKETAQTDPMAVARVLGADPLKIAEGVLGEDEKPELPPEMQAFADQLEELKNENKKLKESQQESNRQMFKQNKVRDISALVRANPERYAFIDLLNSQDPETLGKLYDSGLTQWQENQSEPNWAELLDKNENLIMDEYLKSLQKVKNVPKFQEKLKSIIGQQQTTAAPISTQPPSSPTKTLTNSLSSAQPPLTEPAPTTPEQAKIAARKIPIFKRN